MSDEVFSIDQMKFLDVYVASGFANAWKSYMEAYPDCEEKSAKTSAYKLLKNPHIQKEIQARVRASRLTESSIVDYAVQYAENGLTDPKYALAGVKSMEMLAKYKGMMKDDINVHFSEKNPALFMNPLTKEEMEEIAEKRAKTNRISE